MTYSDELLALHNKLVAEFQGYWSGRPSKDIAARRVASFLAEQALSVVKPELDRLYAELARLREVKSRYNDLIDHFDYVGDRP